MKTVWCTVVFQFVFFVSLGLHAADWRNILNGQDIPIGDHQYADQPYVVKTDDGSWLCIMTIGSLGELVKGSHNYSAAFVSRDMGATWTKPIECNRTYAFPLKTNFERIYALTPESFSYSDDGGMVWSKKIIIPRFTEKSGWGVGMPLVSGSDVFIPWAMIGENRPPRKTEVFFLKSENILKERDPGKIQWKLLPENGKGLRGPEWDKPHNRSEEPHLVRLNNGNLYTVFRTDQGYIGNAVSTDNGATWSYPDKLRYSASDPRIIKHPLACPSLWKCSNGKYLLFFHNHSGKTYNDRNPAWISGGIERNGTIEWSQPEILLYGWDFSEQTGRISYPGFLEDKGRYWIFETQKTIARSHEIPASFLNDLWRQKENTVRVKDATLLAFDSRSKEYSFSTAALKNRASLSIELSFRMTGKAQTLFDGRNSNGEGLLIVITEDYDLRIVVSDRYTRIALNADKNLLRKNDINHFVASFDGGPLIMTLLVNGKLSDGGQLSQYGWTRINADGKSLFPGSTLILDPDRSADIDCMSIYGRALRTSEAVGQYNAYLKK